jgi:integrase
MKARGLGRIYQPKYRDRKTGEWRMSPTWWLDYSFRGEKHRESSGSTRRTKAVKLLRRRLEEMGRGQLVGPDAEKVTFADLTGMVVSDYQVNGRKSLRRAEDAVNRLTEFFAEARALDVTGDRVTAYIRHRQEARAKPASIRYELAILKRGFTLTLRAGKLAHRPYIPSLEVRNVRTGFFEEPESRAVLAHLPEEVRPVCEFAYLTGWRMGEILPLQWRQVDFKAKTVRLEPGTTKNDEGRVFPFSTFPALEALLRHQRERTEALEKATARIIPWVFHRNGEPIKDFRKAWWNACETAGVPGRWRHDFRRTAVRNLERAGVSRSVAKKHTGHKTESVYRRYAIVSEADLSEGVAKLAALHKDQDRTAAEPKVVALSERTGKARAKQRQS